MASSRGERWDRDRLVYERDIDRGRDRDRERDTFIEDDKYYMRGGTGRDRDQVDEFTERRFSRGGPGGGRYEEDIVRERREFDEGPRFEPRREREPPPADYTRRIVIDKERDREYLRSPSPRRPSVLRRQSSLDTFDRGPLRRFYDREEYPPPARREDIYREDLYREEIFRERERERDRDRVERVERERVDRDDFRAPAYTPIPLPRRERERVSYDEINVADPDRYGDENFRPVPERVRERELVRARRRRRSPSRESYTRTTTVRSSSKSSTRSTGSSSSAGGTTVRSSEYPKKGKTRFPARLVSKRALIDFDYPFIEEENVIIVLKALGQENIDDVLRRSEEYKKSEMEILAARSPTTQFEERREEYILPAPPAPGPVIIDAGPAVRSPPAEIVEKTTIIREDSPSLSSHSGHHHHHHHHSHSRRSVESLPVPIGPLALSRARSQSRTNHEIRHEIRALERELEHRPRRDEITERELVRAERLPDGQLVVYEEEVDRVVTHPKPVRIEKDKKGRMSISVPKFR